MTDLGLYRLIDHTQLDAHATTADIDAACDIATRYGCASVCVRPEWVERAANRIRRVSPVGGIPFEITAVIDFPSGRSSSMAKADQASRAIADGATEIDLVMNLDAALAGDWAVVEADIAAVRDASLGSTLKVIIESAALSDQAIVHACLVSVDCTADYVKTSTGFHPAGGASKHAVSLISAVIPAGMGVKASGGIRTKADALTMIAAGATRLGISATEHLAVDSPSSTLSSAY
jgi:deoxyribose-phosphate aldolase